MLPPTNFERDPSSGITRRMSADWQNDSRQETHQQIPQPAFQADHTTDRTDSTPTPSTINLPEKYQFIGQLGRGGMGEVIHAYDIELQRHVAIKFMRTKTAASASARRRFLDEARILAQLHHPNIVDVFERGEIDGEPYFVMAYLDGYSLSERRAEFRTSAGRVVGVMIAVANGVQHAHENGVYHRDLKPSNVMFDDGRPVVVDFGCARWDDAEVSTQGFALLGTPSHMAPEVFEYGSKRHDARADLWAIGVMLYHLLTGELPFTLDPRSPEGREKLLTETPKPLAGHNDIVPGVDDRLEAIVLKTLARNPDDRHQSAAELLTELEGWLAASPASATPSSQRSSVRIRRVLALVSTIAVVCVCVAAVWPGRRSQEPGVADLVNVGQSVVIVDDAGRLIRPLDVKSGFEGGIETVPEVGALRLTSGSNLVANISVDGLARPYTVRADVHHSSENLGSEVGLVVAQQWHAIQEAAAITNTFRGAPSRGVKRDSPGMAYGGARWIDLRNPGHPLKDMAGGLKELPISPHTTSVLGKPLEFRSLAITVTNEDVIWEYEGNLLLRRTWFDLERSSRLKFAAEQRLMPQPLFGDGIGLLVRNGTALFRNVVIEAKKSE